MSESERARETEKARTRQSSSAVRKCERGPRTPMRGDADTSSPGVLDPRNTDNTIRIRHTVRREDVTKKISRRVSATAWAAESRYGEGERKKEKKRVRERADEREKGKIISHLPPDSETLRSRFVIKKTIKISQKNRENLKTFRKMIYSRTLPILSWKSPFASSNDYYREY